MKKKLSKEYLKTVAELAVAGFGLTAALAWNEFIKSLIDKYITAGNDLASRLYYALLITLIAVLVTVYLGRLLGAEEEKENK